MCEINNSFCLKEPDRIQREEYWELLVYYRAKGSRSEGPHGILLHNGLPVELETFHKELETSLGVMKYYALEGPAIWSPTGWNFADKSKILRSTDK